MEREYYRRSMLMAIMRYHAKLGRLGRQEVNQITHHMLEMKSAWVFKNDNGSMELRRQLLAAQSCKLPLRSGSMKQCEQFINNWVRGQF
ncbi:hypothetical protein PYCC9005_004985 [Savitreella phatthalungensis]